MSSTQDFNDIRKNVLVAIPALNEEAHLPKLLFEINKYFPYLMTLVIDDGSKDKTAKIAQSFNCELIKHPFNQGKGASIRSALKFAYENKFTWLITIDGDNQHPPNKIHHFLEYIKKENVDLIIANRGDRHGKMPLHRQLSNGLTSIIISLIGGGYRINDSQCGYRAYKVQRFHSLETTQFGFHFESEILLKALRLKLKISEFEIDTIYTNQKSSIHLVKDTISFIKLVLHYLFYN